jgi:hypothetical protein
MQRSGGGELSREIIVNSRRPLIPFVRRQLEVIMARLEILIASAIFVVATSTVHGNDQVPFSHWLGPQTNDNATAFAPVVGKRIDPVKHDKLSRYTSHLKSQKVATSSCPLPRIQSSLSTEENLQN